VLDVVEKSARSLRTDSRNGAEFRNVDSSAILAFDDGRVVASLVPDARFVPLESRNHILLDTDEAWEQFASEIDEFLSVSGNNSPALLLDRLTSREQEVPGIRGARPQQWRNIDTMKIAEKTVRKSRIDHLKQTRG